MGEHFKPLERSWDRGWDLNLQGGGTPLGLMGGRRGRIALLCVAALSLKRRRLQQVRVRDRG